MLLEEKRADVKSKVGNIDFNIITGSLDGIDHLIVCSQYRCCHEMSARQIRSLMTSVFMRLTPIGLRANVNLLLAIFFSDSWDGPRRKVWLRVVKCI